MIQETQLKNKVDNLDSLKPYNLEDELLNYGDKENWENYWKFNPKEMIS